MLKKRGQVTIFVIIAILIVAGIVLFFYIQNKTSLLSPTIPRDIQPVYNFVQDCLKEIGENALIKIGEQGGYFLIFDEPSIEGRIPYYVYEGRNLMPSKEKIETQISGFVKQEVSYCILNFKDFQRQYNISHNLRRVETKIVNNGISISLDYPITLNKDDSAISLDDFKILLPLDLTKELLVSRAITENIISEKDGFCISCIYDIAQNYGVQVDMLDYGDSTLFSITDNSNKLNNQSYKWSFAIK
jgi:hypothetical protein